MPEETTVKPDKKEHSYSFRLKIGSTHHEQLEKLIADGKAKLANPKTDQYGTGSVVRELLDLHAGKVTGENVEALKEDLKIAVAGNETLHKDFLEIKDAYHKLQTENEKLKTNNQQPTTGSAFDTDEVFQNLKATAEKKYNRQLTDTEFIQLLIAHFCSDPQAALSNDKEYANQMLALYPTIKP